MVCPISDEEIEKLKIFIGICSSNPTILNIPQLDFLKKFIEQLGGKVTSEEFKIPEKQDSKEEPTAKAKVNAPESEPETVPIVESDPESDMDIDNEGCVEPDNDPPQQMGDISKTPTEDEQEQAREQRSKAASAFGDENFTEAISLYTEAIMLNPTNALFYAKRGQAFLKLSKPNACIRDCDRALEINCDSAAAYKYRGRAYRLLGQWEKAAKDLRQACKIDFDEEADEWLREVTPIAKKLEQHKIKYERKQAEKELHERQERIRRAQEANRKAAKEQEEKNANDDIGSGLGSDGTGGTGPGVFSDSEIFNAFKDPEVAAALQDILANPANIIKYQSNPKIMNLVGKIGTAMGGAGGAGGFPGMFGSGAGGFPNFATGAQNNSSAPKPPTDFQDDGLD